MIRKKWFYVLMFLGTIGINSCKHDSLKPDLGDYPEEVGTIIQQRCATAGCHNTKSKDGAGGFDFSTWTHMFEGGRNGSSVIPYRADQSFLTYFINTYPDLGLQLLPTMPNNSTPLSRDEVITIQKWIESGAPNSSGYVWFSDNPERRKFYVCNQGCDLVTVFDSETKLPMRVIDVGNSPTIESPHFIGMSDDGDYWYVVFYAGQVLQKFRTSDDVLVGQATIGAGQWNTMTITHDSKFGFVVDFANGFVTVVDLELMTKLITYSGFINPHGSAVSKDSKTVYITAQSGNCITKNDITDVEAFDPQKVSLETGVPPSETNNHLNIHQVAFCPDGSRYYASCQKTNEVRVMNTANDSLLAIIPLASAPWELDFSSSHPYLFVSCMNDSVSYPGKTGSIAVINYQTNTLVKTIFSGFQPHGVRVDDAFNKAYVANRNTTSNGPAPHHTSTCGGRNGYVTIIDMNTLDLLPGYSTEVSVDPYELGVRK